MAHYAFLNNDNIVTEVIVGIDETELIEGIDPETWYGQFRGQRCVRTSYHGRIRGRYAGIGYRYDDTLDLFVAPQPFPSWAIDDTGEWQPPKPYPTVGAHWWHEPTQEWVPVD
jgi:hypothetical protein